MLVLLLAATDAIHYRCIPLLRRHAAIANYAAACFGEAQQHEYHHCTSENGQEPEDGPPA